MTHTKLAISLASTLFITFNASACDDKACESAYLVETKQHVANHVRRAESYKSERHAYSDMRKRKAYALFVHHHLIRMARDAGDSI